jgi:hypothetical protein
MTRLPVPKGFPMMLTAWKELAGRTTDILLASNGKPDVLDETNEYTLDHVGVKNSPKSQSLEL